MSSSRLAERSRSRSSRRNQAGSRQEYTDDWLVVQTARKESPHTVPEVIARLQNDNPCVRKAAVITLSQMTKRDDALIFNALKARLTDDSFYVRRAAAEVLNPIVSKRDARSAGRLLS